MPTRTVHFSKNTFQMDVSSRFLSFRVHSTSTMMCKNNLIQQQELSAEPERKVNEDKYNWLGYDHVTDHIRPSAYPGPLNDKCNVHGHHTVAIICVLRTACTSIGMLKFDYIYSSRSVYLGLSAGNHGFRNFDEAASQRSTIYGGA